MSWDLIRRRGILLLVLIAGVIAYWKLYPHPPKVISIGYVADRSVMLWNTLAQVREPIADLHYGERVEVLRESGPSVQVRTDSGTIGWLLDSRLLMDSEIWTASVALLQRAKSLPVQARGHTKTVSNVRLEPGRNGKRVFQFSRGAPVVVLERRVAEAAPAGEENPQAEKNAEDSDQKPRQEDWLLILRAPEFSPVPVSPTSAETTTTPANPASSGPVSSGPDNAAPDTLVTTSTFTPIAGWVLARFIEFDLPGPVRDQANSADFHVLAWFELNRVPDGSGGTVPQYLAAGSRGGEGQPCDFTMLRVYTWGVAKKRYETAFIENDLCGRLPIIVSQGLKGPEFHFSDVSGRLPVRNYVMQLTSVRLVSEKSSVGKMPHK